LLEQGADSRAVIGIRPAELCREDLAGVDIHTDVELAPGAASSAAMLLGQPFTSASEFQARAVHEQMHRLAP
jgi:hypothetical protein